MGTRNLTAVVKDGEYKIAQYGQWDGYPSGQGATILDFLQSEENVQRLKESIKRVRFLDFEGVDKNFVSSYESNAPKWSSDPDNRTEEQKNGLRRYFPETLAGRYLKT